MIFVDSNVFIYTELKTFDRPLLTAFGKRKKRTIHPPGD